jgi:hypothetical protein
LALLRWADQRGTRGREEPVAAPYNATGAGSSSANGCNTALPPALEAIHALDGMSLEIPEGMILVIVIIRKISLDFSSIGYMIFLAGDS